MKLALRLASFPLYHGSFPALPPPDGAAAAGAAEPSPTTPMTESLERYLSMTSGGWIMSNSSVASLPAKVRIASSPPGWSFQKISHVKHFVMQDDPAAVLVVVLSNFFFGDTRSCRSSCTCSCSRSPASACLS